MKIWVDADEAYPVYKVSVVYTDYGDEIDVPDDFWPQWLAARDEYWKLNTEIEDLVDEFRAR